MKSRPSIHVFCKLGISFMLLFLCVSGLSASQYRLLGWPASIDGLYMMVDGNIVPAPILFGKASRYFELPSGQRLTLYRKNEKAGEPNEPPYLPVASLPGGQIPGSSCIILVFELENGNYRLIPIDDNRTDYPIGSVVVCSVVPYKIGLKIGDKVSMIDPLSVFVPEQVPVNSNSNIQIGGYRSTDNVVKFNTNLFVRRGYRYFLFINDTAAIPVPSRPEDSGLNVFTLSDYLPTAAAR